MSTVLDMGRIIMDDKDVTSLIEQGEIDDEVMSILKCVCGEKFHDWKFYIGIYRNRPYRCNKCNRGLYFSVSVRIYEVAE